MSAARLGTPRGQVRGPVQRGRVLIVDDEVVIASTLQEFLQGEGFETQVAHDAETALAVAADFEPELALCDVQLPGLDGLELLDRLLKVCPESLVLMITAYATVENAVAAFRRGAQDYLMKPVIFDELLAKLDRLMEYRQLHRENRALRRQLHATSGTDELIGESVPMRQVKDLIRRVGPTPSTVLITGESGTGKELAARAVHRHGQHPNEPFLAVNCAAIPHDLLENQLFGHVRGAYTGAMGDHDGLFVAAGRGTVFLDEIGELPMATQAKLLRAIEAKEVLPVGANRPAAVAARVVAATNKDLPSEVAAGRFRADLYYRLNVVSIALPALRERPSDVPAIVAALLGRHARKLGRAVDGVDTPTLRRLMAAPWRGNVRELENALERAIILAEGSVLTAIDFPAELVRPTGPDLEAETDDLRAVLARREREHVRQVLERCGGDKREAARRLGLGLSSLYRKIEEYGPS